MNIITRFLVEGMARLRGGSHAVATTKKLGTEARRTRRRIDSIGKSQGLLQWSRQADLMQRGLTRLRVGLQGLAVGGVIGAGIGFAVRSLSELNDEFRQTELNLARTLTVLTGASFAEGLEVAPEAFRHLAKAAASTPGTDQEFVETFSQLASFGPKLGLTFDSLTRLSQQALVGGQLTRGRIGRQTAGVDIQQALTTTVSDRLTPIVANILRQSKIDQGDFNAMGMRERFDTLTEALNSLDPVIEALNSTFQARTTTLTSLMKQLTNAGTKSFTGGVSDRIGNVNDFIFDNLDRFLAVADGVQPLVAVLGAVGVVGGLAIGVLAALVGILTAVSVVAGTAIGGAFFAAMPFILGAVAALGLIFAAWAVVWVPLLAALYQVEPLVKLLAFSFEALLFELVALLTPVEDFFRVLAELLGPTLVWLGVFIGSVLSIELQQAARLVRFFGDSLTALGFVLQGISLNVRSIGQFMVGNNGNGQFLGERSQEMYRRAAFAQLKAVTSYNDPLSNFEVKEGGLLEFLKSILAETKTTIHAGGITLNIETDTIDDPQRMAVVLQQALVEINTRRSQAVSLRRKGDL